MAQRREYVASLYRDVLGREGNEQEIEGHLNNPGSEADLRNFFMTSPEYTSQHGGEASWQDVGGVVTPTQNAPPPPPTNGTLPIGDTQPNGSPTTNVTGGPPPPPLDLSAFNMGRAQDTSKSAKDAYASLSSAAPPPPLHDRVAFQSWLNQYIVPGMNALGHRVLRVDENGFEYENHEGRFYVDAAQNLGAAPGTVRDQRLHWNATPADDATRARYAGSGGGSGGGPGTGSGTQRTVDGIRNLYSQLGQQYGGPGSAGVMNGPVQQVGQDPLSQLITGGLAALIGGEGMTTDGSGVMASLRSIIERGGQLPNDASAKRFESARELMAKGERTALNDSRAALADRGLLSEPGNPSGVERGTIGRIQTRNAEEFARALRDIGIAEDDASNTRLTAALGLATGMATDQARTLLATLGAGTDRQQMLAQVALESLQTNMAWNQFLAKFGLEREQAMYAIQNGQIDQIMPLLAMFLQLAQSTQRGYV